MGALSAIKSVAGGMKKGLNAGKDFAKKVGTNAGDAFKEGMKNIWKKIPFALKIKICLVAGLVLVIMVVLMSIMGTNSESAGNVAKESAKSVKEKVLAGELDGSKDQIEFAAKINETYHSNIGYTLKQIEYMSKQGIEELNKKSNNGHDSFKSYYGSLTTTIKSNIKNNYEQYEKFGLTADRDNMAKQVEDVVWYYEYTNEGKQTNNIISPCDKTTLYEHILKTEKYNFNMIDWRKYTHTDTDKEIAKDKLTYDSSLGLLYPTDGGAKLRDFIEMASPYLLASDIPRTFVSSSVYNTANHDTIGQTMVQTLADKEGQRYDHYGDFGYEILKNGYSDIKINEYELQTCNNKTNYKDYLTYNNLVDEASFEVKYEPITETKTVIGNIFNGEPILKEETNIVDYKATSVTLKSYKSGTENLDPSTGVKTDTRIGDDGKIDVMKEDAEGRTITKSYQYKVASAKAFDVTVNISYDYTRYEDEDVDNRTNEDAYKTELEEYKKFSSDDDHYTLEECQAITSYDDLESKFALTTSSGSRESGTVVYSAVAKTPYSYDDGNIVHVTRVYRDHLAPEPTNTTKVMMGVATVMSYDKNEHKYVTRKTIESSEFSKDPESLKYYNELSQKDGTCVNNIDVINSNPKIFANYMSVGNKFAEYVGYKRSDFAFTQGMSLLKSSFQKIAKENEDALPWVYGASLGFDVGADRAPLGGASGMSGINLLIEYIESKEGNPTLVRMKDESGNATVDRETAKYYAVYDVLGNRTVGYGIDLETSGRENEIKTAMGLSSISVGTLIDKELVDSIEKEIITSDYDNVVAYTSGLDLKEYQLHALTSRYYNCGCGGYKSVRNGKSLFQAIQSYWNAETDDKYETLYEQYGDNPEGNRSSIIAAVDLNHALFQQYLSMPNNGGVLDSRRESEYTLFVSGYYESLNRFWSPNAGGVPDGIVLVEGDQVVEAGLLELQDWYENNIFSGTIPKCDRNVWSGAAVCPNDGKGNDPYGHLNWTEYGDVIRKSPGLYYQCPWWSHSRGALYFKMMDRMDLAQIMTTGNTNDGIGAAQRAAEKLGITQYLVYDVNQIEPNSITQGVSSSNHGHTMWVEAVTSDYIIVSDCGGGKDWYGVHAIKKSDFASRFRGAICLTYALGK